MAQTIRETTVTQERQERNAIPGDYATRRVDRVASTEPVVSPTYSVQNLVNFVLGIIEFLLLFRFVFRVTGANPSTGFVSFIYGITRPLILPFEGIFSRATTTGAETTAVFEPATLVAMVVYAMLAWGIMKLIQIASGSAEPATV